MDEFRAATKEGDQCFLLAQAETSEKPPFGESSNPGRLCVGRKAGVLMCWRYP